MQVISVEKDWKPNVLIQKVVTLNTCSDVACLTFQLPHITTSSFQSRRWQPTTGCHQSLQRLKERNKPSVRWKSFAIHMLVLWHYWVVWASGLQLVFFSDNINSQNYVWITLLKMTFWISQGKVATSVRLSGEVDKSVRFVCQIFSWFNVPKIIKIIKIG